MTDARETGRSPKVLDIATVELESTPPRFDEDTVAQAATPRSQARSWRWLALFASAFGGLILFGVALWADTLVRDLMARHPALGYAALGLAGLALLGFLGFLVKEMRGFFRLRALDTLRNDLAKAHDTEHLSDARKAIEHLLAIYRRYPNTAAGRARFETQRAGVMDARDLIVIAEDTIMTPLDQEAVRLVSGAARRVSLVTALSPRALVDIAMVVFQCINLTRKVAELYGARPGMLGGLRLVRHMMEHLAITGGMAATEGLVSQVLGHSLAARLSTRLGEGVINGLLTARVGVAAIAVTRPMPFLASRGPTLSEVTRGMANLGRSKDDDRLDTNDGAASSTSPAADRTR